MDCFLSSSVISSGTGEKEGNDSVLLFPFAVCWIEGGGSCLVGEDLSCGEVAGIGVVGISCSVLALKEQSFQIPLQKKHTMVV